MQPIETKPSPLTVRTTLTGMVSGTPSLCGLTFTMAVAPFSIFVALSKRLISNPCTDTLSIEAGTQASLPSSLTSQRRLTVMRRDADLSPRSETTPSAQPAKMRLSRFQPPTTSVTSAL
ncbi:hypothetical protein D3C86_1554610 [compost metagenome]